MSTAYDDIIDLPHHVSSSRRHMPLTDRAVQFSPFAALSGYDSAVKETERLTDRRIELDEYEKDEINAKLIYVSEHVGENIEFTFTYFVPDAKKNGGAYVTRSAGVSRVDRYTQTVKLEDGTVIPICDIHKIVGDF